MKVRLHEDGYIITEMTPEDASEDELQDRLATIVALAKEIEQRGASAEKRQADRRGYWRYCQAEKSLNLIVSCAQEALNHIKWLDFPSDETDAATESKEASRNLN